MRISDMLLASAELLAERGDLDGLRTLANDGNGAVPRFGLNPGWSIASA